MRKILSILGFVLILAVPVSSQAQQNSSVKDAVKDAVKEATSQDSSSSGNQRGRGSDGIRDKGSRGDSSARSDGSKNERSRENAQRDNSPRNDGQKNDRKDVSDRSRKDNDITGSTKTLSRSEIDRALGIDRGSKNKNESGRRSERRDTRDNSKFERRDRRDKDFYDRKDRQRDIRYSPDYPSQDYSRNERYNARERSPLFRAEERRAYGRDHRNPRYGWNGQRQERYHGSSKRHDRRYRAPSSSYEGGAYERAAPLPSNTSTYEYYAQRIEENEMQIARGMRMLQQTRDPALRRYLLRMIEARESQIEQLEDYLNRAEI